LSKSAQAIENKGEELEKEWQERKRVRKLLKIDGLLETRAEKAALKGERVPKRTDSAWCKRVTEKEC
jgi:hypothetical protein